MDFKSEDVALVIMVLGAALLLLETPVQRRWWTRPWLNHTNRRNLHLVHEELVNDDTESYKNFLRMDKPTFDILLGLITPDIEKKDTILRESISARDRLTVALRYLATGETYKSLMYSCRIGHATISKIVPECCEAIYKHLKKRYLQIPSTAAEWLNIAQEFEEKWNLPNTLGAMDGKHILINAPQSEGSAYFNYKGQHSIVLLAVVDANYKFTYVDVGCNGRVSDGGVFARSDLSGAIYSNKLNFPEKRPLPGRTKPVPFVIVTDAAFPLSDNILKPFPFRNMTDKQRRFNYRLSRARRVVENAFGILTNRFRVLLNTSNLRPEKIQIITLACVALHNFLRTKCPSKYAVVNDNDIDRRYTFKYGLSQQGGNRCKKSAMGIRDEFLEYVNGVGAVPWQNNLA